MADATRRGADPPGRQYHPGVFATLTRRIKGSLVAQALVVAVVALAINLPMLGRSGLADSEGFRALPAWEAPAPGTSLVTCLFGQAYLRKPPGIVWAIRAASWVVGQNELGARLPSALAALAAALVCFSVAHRWFGSPYGMYAGLAALLTPWSWRWARSAEIESLHMLWVTLAVLSLASLLTGLGRFGRRRSLLWALAAGLGLAGMLLTKGPAGLAAVGGVVLAAAWTQRRWGVLTSGWLWLVLALGVLPFGGWLWALSRELAQAGVTPVLESPGRFLWRPGEGLGVALLGPITLVSALPFSLALLPALAGPGLREMPGERAMAEVFGVTVSRGVVLALAIYTLVGVSNNRYAMPATAGLGIVYAFALRRHVWNASEAARRVGRGLLFDHRGLVLGLLAIAGVAHAAWLDVRRERTTSGRAAGLALGEALAATHTPGVLWADRLVDTRPEVLWYAQRRAIAGGVAIQVRWRPGLGAEAATPGPYAAFLTAQTNDPTVTSEMPRGLDGPVIYAGRAHVFDFTVVEVSPVRTSPEPRP